VIFVARRIPRGTPKKKAKKRLGKLRTTTRVPNSRAKRKNLGVNQPAPPTKPLKRSRIKLKRGERNERRVAILGTGKPPSRPYGTSRTKTGRGKARGARRALAGLTRTSSGRLIPVEEKVARAATASQKRQLTEQEQRSAEYYSKKNARQIENRVRARAKAKERKKKEKELIKKQQELERIRKIGEQEEERYRRRFISWR